jgi:hypothetical protein
LSSSAASTNSSLAMNWSPRCCASLSVRLSSWRLRARHCLRRCGHRAWVDSSRAESRSSLRPLLLHFDQNYLHIRPCTVGLMDVKNSNGLPQRFMLPAPPLPANDSRWALLLDVDGTCSISPTTRGLSKSLHLLDLLHSLHNALGGALALVSGRGLDDLDRLFGNPRWAAIGLHGLQLRHADGSFRRIDVAPEQQERMREAARSLAARFDGVQLEDKRIGRSRCTADAGPNSSESLHDAAANCCVTLPGYELQPGNGCSNSSQRHGQRSRRTRTAWQRERSSGACPCTWVMTSPTNTRSPSVNQHGISVRDRLARLPRRHLFPCVTPLR